MRRVLRGEGQASTLNEGMTPDKMPESWHQILGNCLGERDTYRVHEGGNDHPNSDPDARPGYDHVRHSGAHGVGGAITYTRKPQTLNSYIQALQKMVSSVPGAGNLPIGSVVDEGGWIAEFEPITAEPELITISDPDAPDYRREGDTGSGGEIPPGQYIVTGRHYR